MNLCADNQHDFNEVYYGWQCTQCDLFYAFGTAPWEEEPSQYPYGIEDDYAD